MAVASAWWERDPTTKEEVRRGLIMCDECVDRPWDIALREKRQGIGSANFLRDRGWRFDDFEAGPHSCHVCARPGRRRRWYFPASRSVTAPALPNLIVIGAQKSGTNALHNYLSLHPEIHMSEPKELNFFHYPNCLERLDTYATYFDGRSPVRGESSPTYAFFPIAPGVPERIHGAVPGAKLIYVARDPVERAISAYSTFHAWDLAPWPPEVWLGDIENPYNQFLAPSKYASQLQGYLRLFTPGQLLVVDHADLRDRRHETLRRVFRFLDVDGEFVDSGFDQLVAERATVRRGSRLGGRLRRSRLAELVRMLPHRPREAVFRPIRRTFSRRVDAPPVDERTRAALRDALRAEAAGLREMTGQSYPTWQV